MGTSHLSNSVSALRSPQLPATASLITTQPPLTFLQTMRALWLQYNRSNYLHDKISDMTQLVVTLGEAKKSNNLIWKLGLFTHLMMPHFELGIWRCEGECKMTVRYVPLLPMSYIKRARINVIPKIIFLKVWPNPAPVICCDHSWGWQIRKDNLWRITA